MLYNNSTTTLTDMITKLVKTSKSKGLHGLVVIEEAQEMKIVYKYISSALIPITPLEKKRESDDVMDL